MDIDVVFKDIGEFGIYQKKIFFSCASLQIFAAWHMIHMVIVGAKVPFFCLNQLTNDTCSLIPKCTKYSYSTTRSSIRTEWNLVCENGYKADLVQSIFMAGVLVGALFFGSLSDKYGRLKPLYLSIGGLTIMSLAGTLSLNYYMYCTMRCLAGVFCGGMILVSFVLASEIVGSSYRAMCGTIMPGIFALGILLFAGLGALIRSWRLFSAAVSVPGLLCIAFYWYMPESPRWLLSRGEVSAAERILEKIAKQNGNPARGAIALKSSTSSKSVEHGFVDLMRHPILRQRTLIQLTVCCVYYGITMSSGDIGSNLYMSIALSGLVEIPAYVITVPLLQRLGRKWTFCGFMMIGGIACLAILITPPGWIRASYLWREIGTFSDSSAAMTTLAMVGKLSISASFAVAYIYSAELYPTVIRNLGMGVCSMAARFGGIVSPLIIPLGHMYRNVPNLQFIVFGLLSVLGAIFSLKLPETLSEPMPETIADMERNERGTLVELNSLADDKVRLMDDEEETV